MRTTTRNLSHVSFIYEVNVKKPRASRVSCQAFSGSQILWRWAWRSSTLISLEPGPRMIRPISFVLHKSNCFLWNSGSILSTVESPYGLEEASPCWIGIIQSPWIIEKQKLAFCFAPDSERKLEEMTGWMQRRCVVRYGGHVEREGSSKGKVSFAEGNKVSSASPKNQEDAVETNKI